MGNSMKTAPKIYKMRIVFTVADNWDHKHIMTILRELVLRSGLPFEPAKVNKNWPRLAYSPVLGYKQYSLGEVADLYFSAPVMEADAQAAFVKSAPDGVRVLRVRRVPYALPSVMSLAEVMKYSVGGNFSSYAPAQSAEQFFRGKHIYVSEEAPNGLVLQRDLKPFILQAAQPQPDQVELWLQRCADKTVKPEYVIAAWLNVQVPAAEEFTLPDLTFTREGLYWRDSQGNLHAIN